MTEIERSIVNLKNGNTAAIEFLYEKYKRLLLRHARDRGLSTKDAEERVNDTFMRVITQIHKFTYENDASFTRWLLVVHKNIVLLFIRERKRKTILTEPLEEDNIAECRGLDDVAEDSKNDKRMKIISNEFGKLDESDRILLTMRANGIAYRDIGECLGVAHDNLKVRYKRVWDKLKNTLTENFKELEGI